MANLGFLPPDDEAEFVDRQFWELLRSRTPQDVLLFLAYYLNSRRPVAEVAKELGLPLATAASKLVEIEAAYRTLRDLRQPPHAAD